MKRHAHLSKAHRALAVYYAGQNLVWDVYLTCPQAAKGAYWYYLQKSAWRLGDRLLKVCPGADETGCAIMEKLAWDAKPQYV